MPRIVVLLSLLLTAGVPLQAADGLVATLEMTAGVPSADGRELAVEIDLARLRSEPQRLSIPLPDLRLVVAMQSRVDRTSAERFSWFGTIKDGLVDGDVSLHYNEGRLRGTVRLADGVSYLLSTENGAYRLVEVEPAKGDTCALAPHKQPIPGLETVVKGGGLMSINAALDSRTACFPLKVLYLINVMVLYPESLAPQKQQVEDYAADQIAESNNIFANSGVNIRYLLAYVGKITGSQPTTGGSSPTSSALSWLNGQFSGAPNTEVELLAETHNADMITIVIPPDPNLNCGIANLPELDAAGNEVMYSRFAPLPPGQGIPFNDRAFSVVELNCGLIDLTFAHELGHTFGMRHDVEARGPEESLPWAYGHIIEDGGQGQKATVMGCVGNALPCFRLKLFSTPLRSFLGKPAGVHSPSSSQAYNACVASSRALRYATIR